METNIKTNLQERIESNQPLVVEIGCGKKKSQNRINVDRVDMPHVDIVADIEKGLKFFPDRCVDELYGFSVLEHIQNFKLLMAEIVRILKENGKAFIFVPHFSNPHFYSDWTHVRAFGLYSFYYFVSQQKQLRRKVPDFYTETKIRIVSQRLVFKSYVKIPGTKYKIPRLCKFLYEWFFNLHPNLQECYEEYFCYIFPCSGIEVVFTPEQIN